MVMIVICKGQGCKAMETFAGSAFEVFFFIGFFKLILSSPVTHAAVTRHNPSRAQDVWVL